MDSAAVTPFWTPPTDEATDLDETEAEETLLARLARCGPLAPRQRRAARRVPLGRRRFEPRRRPDGRGLVAAGEDLLDRLRRAGLRRARRRTADGDSTSGADHHEFVVRPDALAIVDRIVAHFDEPFADASAIPTWYVSELARRHVTVVLSGDGGDELFAGYDRYVPHAQVARFDTLPVPGKRALAGLAARTLPHGARGQRFLRHVARDEESRYIESVSFFGPEDRQALLDRGFAAGAGEPEDRMRAAVRRPARTCRWSAG